MTQREFPDWLCVSLSRCLIRRRAETDGRNISHKLARHLVWSARTALAYRHPALFSPRASPAWDRMLVKRDKDRLINRWDQTSKPEMEQTEASGTSETLPISIIRTQEKERERERVGCVLNVCRCVETQGIFSPTDSQMNLRWAWGEIHSNGKRYVGKLVYEKGEGVWCW